MKKLLLLLVLMVATACGSAAAPVEQSSMASEPAMAPAVDEAGAMPESLAYDKAVPPMEGGVAGTGSTAPLDPGERLVIRDAMLNIQVEDVNAADQAIRKAVADAKGYVLSSSTGGYDSDVTIYLSLKVPSDQLDATITLVEKLAHKVVARSMSGTDVTEEYVDLSGRLSAQEAARDRLLILLDKAETVEEAIAVNNALTEVQATIESLTGRMRYLRQGASFSSLTVELHMIPTTPIVSPDGWQPIEDAKVALRGLLDFFQELATFVIGFLIWTPVWLPLFFLVRWLRKRWQQRKQLPPSA